MSFTVCVSTQQGVWGKLMVWDHLLNPCIPGSILQNTLVSHWQMLCSIIIINLLQCITNVCIKTDCRRSFLTKPSQTVMLPLRGCNLKEKILFLIFTRICFSRSRDLISYCSIIE